MKRIPVAPQVSPAPDFDAERLRISRRNFFGQAGALALAAYVLAQ